MRRRTCTHFYGKRFRWYPTAIHCWAFLEASSVKESSLFLSRSSPHSINIIMRDDKNDGCIYIPSHDRPLQILRIFNDKETRLILRFYFPTTCNFFVNLQWKLHSLGCVWSKRSLDWCILPTHRISSTTYIMTTQSNFHIRHTNLFFLLISMMLYLLFFVVRNLRPNFYDHIANMYV